MKKSLKRVIFIDDDTSCIHTGRQKFRTSDSVSSGAVFTSSVMLRIQKLVRRVATSRANVLITGESGVGKEVVAQNIHRASERPQSPFVAVNCSAIPESLLESELFGHAKGAFTGALQMKRGLFEEANGGILFLDEIGDLCLPLQAKLLRVLQERCLKRVGENESISIDVTVVAATHKDLEEEVRQGRFREDLFYRLNVIPIHIPPLRERQEDILPLAEHFLSKFSAKHQKGRLEFSYLAKESLLKKPWYGNVRELENAIERAVVLSDSAVIDVCDLPEEGFKTRCKTLSSQQGNTQSWPTLHEHSLSYIQQVVEHCGGVKEKAAQLLGIDRKTLYRRLSELRSPRRADGQQALNSY